MSSDMQLVRCVVSAESTTVLIPGGSTIVVKGQFKPKPFGLDKADIVVRMFGWPNVRRVRRMQKQISSSHNPRSPRPLDIEMHSAQFKALQKYTRKTRRRARSVSAEYLALSR
ncbi:MAG: hypothetical protein JWM37_645 [Candidatus Saccharibacteria bacterium]|nr:hypothetical protein [Candidatus Saccharibacteria bacterium]